MSNMEPPEAAVEIILIILVTVGMCSGDDSQYFFRDGGGGAAGWFDGSGEHGGDGGHGGAPTCSCSDGNPCNGLEGCADDGSCIIIGPPEVPDDNNDCTADECVDGVPVNRSIVDDGDPCTIDLCEPYNGPPYHYPIPDCHN